MANRKGGAFPNRQREQQIFSQGWQKHFFGGQAKNIMESNGALARREIFKFNYIHDYDVIIFGHEQVTGMLSLPMRTRQREKNGSDF